MIALRSGKLGRNGQVSLVVMKPGVEVGTNGTMVNPRPRSVIAITDSRFDGFKAASLQGYQSCVVADKVSNGVVTGAEKGPAKRAFSYWWWAVATGTITQHRIPDTSIDLSMVRIDAFVALQLLKSCLNTDPQNATKTRCICGLGEHL